MTHQNVAADVVVIGAGIAGAADAFFLSRAGREVTVLEQSEQPGSLTTGKAAACFRAQASWEVFSRLAQPSISFYENFAAEIGLPEWHIGLKQQGWLFLTGASDGPSRCRAFIESNRRLGVHDSELLIGPELQRRFSWVSAKATAGTYRAKDGWLSPYEATMGFLRASAADVRLSTRVVAIDDHGSLKAIHTNRGDLTARDIVIACGPFSGEVAALAGVELDVLPTRRQLAFVSDCSEVPTEGPMVADADNHAYWRPEGSGAIVSVTRREEPASPALEIGTDWTFAAEAMNANAQLTPFWTDVAARVSRGRLRTLAGQYTCTPDGAPYIGALPVQGLFVHTGDNGWGIETAPAAGELLADAVREQRSPDSDYAPTRRMVRGPLRLASNWP